MFTSPIEAQRKISHFFMVMDISKFTDVQSFKNNLQGMADRIRQLPKSGEEEVMVAGDPEWRTEAERRTNGIPIAEGNWDALLKAADRAAPGLQDVVANFNMVKARETAWANGETLWALRQVSSSLEASFLDGLDHLVGFAGRGLLVPLRLAL